MRLARDSTGAALVGDSDSFVPIADLPGPLEDGDELLAVDPAKRPAVPSEANKLPADAIDFACPLASPGTLWGVGLNYASHAEDLSATHPDQPATFLRPPTTITRPGGTVSLPSSTEPDRVTAEGELAIVIGDRCRSVSVQNAEAAISGIMPILDFTAEDILEQNPRFLTQAKSYDGFLVFGPWIQTIESVENLGSLTVETTIDNETVSSAPVSDMRFSPQEIVAHLSEVCTLQSGDIICTGTPGAGPVMDGSTVTARLTGVGSTSASVVGPHTEAPASPEESA